MSLDRTPPVHRSSTNNALGEASNLESTTLTDPTNEPMICHSCNEMLIDGQDILSLNNCSHTFHSNCIESHLSSSAECPSCKLHCQLSDLRTISIGPRPQTKAAPRGKGRGAMSSKHYNTRYAKKNIFQEQNNLLNLSTDLQGAVGITPTPQMRNNEPMQETHRSLIPQNVTTSVDYAEIQKMVESSLSNLLTRLNILPNNSSGQNPTVQNSIPINGNNTNRVRSPDQHPQHSQPQLQPQFRIPNSPNSFSVSSVPLQPDKVTTIIQNWHLKFDGSPTGLTVDEFLYRVRTLTEDNFNSDFSLLCKNLNILLSGKAREWYWRYRKNANPVVWEDFCDAIKFQYRDFKTSFDIREEIRNRKQKVGESFDSFLEAVTSIHDRLPTQMSELELIEILTRNLRPEIRQDLLYIPVNSITHLRKLVHIRENFLNDDFVKRQLSNRTTNSYTIKRQIAEISEYPLESCGDNQDSINAIQNFPTESKCWNCNEIGHFWENCLNERKVFCYGCGAKDTYKPNCPTCLDTKLQFHRNFRQGNPTKKHP